MFNVSNTLQGIAKSLPKVKQVSATNSKATRIQVYQSIAKVNKTFMPASQKQCFIKPIAQN